MGYIFKVAYKKGSKHLLKIEVEGKDEWMNTTEEVYNYAKEKFEDGDKIGVEYIMKGKLYHAVRVNTDGKNVELQESEDNTTSKESTSEKREENLKPTCIDCGKELKDSKYKKCYTCNQKNPVKSTSTTRSPETVASIKMQCAYKAAAQAMVVFTGQIADLDVLKSQLDDLANHIVNKF